MYNPTFPYFSITIFISHVKALHKNAQLSKKFTNRGLID